MIDQEHPSVRFHILTVYPNLFTSFLSQGLLQKAIEAGKLTVEIIDFRDEGIGKHRKVDDTPYGGGAGMVLRPEPIIDSLEKIDKELKGHKSRRILISPQGEPFRQAKAQETAAIKHNVKLLETYSKEINVTENELKKYQMLEPAY